MDGWLTTLLVAHNSYSLRMVVAVEIHPALAEWSIWLVAVVQALKIKWGGHVIIHSVCMCVCVRMGVYGDYGDLPILVCCLA